MHSLDNVIWQALSSSQAHLGIAAPLARRFDPDISLLGALAEDSSGALESPAEITGVNPAGLLLEREGVSQRFPWLVGYAY